MTQACVAAGGGQQVERVENVVEEKGEQTDEDESASHSDESQAEEADTESHKEEKVRPEVCGVETYNATVNP